MADDSMNLRFATMHDADLLLHWRNDETTRAASHNSAKISNEKHCEWLKGVMSNDDYTILIAEIDGLPVGTVRSFCVDGVSEISWTIAPSARNQGMAKRMVRMFVSTIPGPIRAEVKVGNVASVRVAEQAGMKFESENNGILYYGRGPRP